MIRFPCPNPSCDRDYAVPDALARLPLICKGCGQRLTVPGPGETVRRKRKRAEPPPTEPAADGVPGGDEPGDDFNLGGVGEEDAETGDQESDPLDDRGDGSDEEPDDTDDAGAEPEDDEPPIFLSDEVRGKLDLKPAGPAPRPTPVPPPAEPPGRRVLGIAADVAAALVLAAGGALLGEFVARRSSADVLRGAGSAPLDLVVWLGCVAVPVLVYVLFANRGQSLGGWLRRRLAG